MASFRKKIVRAVSRLRLPRRRQDDQSGRNANKTKPPKKGDLPPAEIVQPDEPIQMLLRAASFAARKHRGQTRADGTTPYFSHVARVTIILSHVFGVTDRATLTAAFLHDSLEDTDTDYDELEEVFGKTIAAYVVALTKNVMLPKRKRETEYEKRLLAAPENVKIAKMADIYDNLSDRVNSPKIVKTTQTAERLLAAFGSLLETPLGQSAHAITMDLLATIESKARE